MPANVKRFTAESVDDAFKRCGMDVISRWPRDRWLIHWSEGEAKIVWYHGRRQESVVLPVKDDGDGDAVAAITAFVVSTEKRIKREAN